MYRKFVLILILFFPINFIAKLFAQDKRDIGLQLGGTYYYGDFNETTPFYKPSLGAGIIFRYNFNNFYSIRISALYGSITGSSPTDQYLPQVESNASFSKTIIDAEIMGEFNFLPFNPINERDRRFTPFVNLGVGASKIGGTVAPSIPFGIGIKFAPLHRHTVALEWRFHKTFTDSIDDYQAPSDGKSAVIHNNDWVSFIGLVYTFRLFNGDNPCPVYQ